MPDEIPVFFTKSFFRAIARKAKKEEEARQKAEEKTARALEKALKAQEKTAQQAWDELPAPATNPDWDYPTHGGDILKELVGAVEGYAANGGELPAFLCLDENGRFWLTPDVGSGSSPWAFEATATPELDGDGDPTGNYAVNIRGGTAQAIGGGTAVFPDHSFSRINDEEFFYIRFFLWDNTFEPTCYWYNDPTGAACTIEHGQTLPVSADNTRFITLVLCKVDSTVPGAIVQYRAGAIDIDATLAAGVAGSGITVRNISASQSGSGS
ncbi:MAG: hypothetical protein IJT88_02545 [Kiritimatiellae bacterium]|nr:hypothetical protein [Kiritimatiellia bacterium]